MFETHTSWRTASVCHTGSCVQVAFFEDSVMVRDSKDPNGPRLVITPADWRSFLDGVKKDEFDNLA